MNSSNSSKWKLFASTSLMLATATCTQQQIDFAAETGCQLATVEAQAHASSTNPYIKVAVSAIGAICADPGASAAEVNAARVGLKNAIKSSS